MHTSWMYDCWSGIQSTVRVQVCQEDRDLKKELSRIASTKYQQARLHRYGPLNHLITYTAIIEALFAVTGSCGLEVSR